MKPNVAAYLESWGVELRARQDRVRQLIGDAHWLTDGHHKEAILRDFLARYLPSECECSTGFVRGAYEQSACSPEVDILLFSRRAHLPYFCEGGVSIIDPTSLLATIEVKSNFSKEPLKDAIENVKLVRKIAAHPDCTLLNLWSGIFFYELPESRTLESAVQTLSDVIKSSFLEKSEYYWLPTCIVMGQNCLVFPKEKDGRVHIRAFQASNRAFASGISDLLASIGPQIGGLTLSGFEEWGVQGEFKSIEQYI